jgi:hypothetical protein
MGIPKEECAGTARLLREMNERQNIEDDLGKEGADRMLAKEFRRAGMPTTPEQAADFVARVELITQGKIDMAAEYARQQVLAAKVAIATLKAAAVVTVPQD